jgi:AbiTii
MPDFNDLRDSVADSRVSLADVLRRAKILSYRLGEKSFKQWVEYELNGYPEDVSIPTYRRLQIPSLGTFLGPYGFQVRNQILPTYSLPPEITNIADTVPLYQGLHEIEQMAHSEEELTRHWPAEAVMLACKHIQLANGAQLIEAYQVLTKPLLEGVLDAVRNRFLDFLLELQDAHPEVTQSTSGGSKIPQEGVSQIFNITIHGDHSVVASGRDVTQLINQAVATNDLDAVLRIAHALKVPDKDIKELRSAVKADGTPKQKEFGPKVKGRLGKAMGKLATGARQTTLHTAPTLISKGLAKYYGWE